MGCGIRERSLGRPSPGHGLTLLKLARLPSGEPEIFASIQGEGVSAGRPSTFVRLSLCNLACTWCDTKYTWDWARHDPRVEIALAPVAEIVGRVSALGVENVVITGGEPLIQQDALLDVAGALTSAGHRIEVETNGTFMPQPSLRVHVAQWNVSPKLANSGNATRHRLVDEPLRWFAQSEDAWLKFVIDAPADLDEVEALVGAYEVPRKRVILMPQGASVDELNRRSAWLVDACTLRGYRFSTRLHILLWGDERGR